MRHSRRMIFFNILFFLGLSIFLASLTFVVLSIVNKEIFGDYTTMVEIIAIFTSIIVFQLTILTLRYLFSQRDLFNELRKENSYTLGHDIVFYNLNAFKHMVNRQNRKRHLLSKRKYIIAFTCTSSETSSNYVSNSTVNELNYLVATYLSSLFKNKKGTFTSKNTVYGFNRGFFLIYASIDREEDINQLITTISNEIYRVVTEEKLKIWAQPFYGIREYHIGDNLTGAIEDAFLARNQGEANFECYTFFKQKGNKEETSNVNDEIINALNNDEFIPYYQPKYSLKEKKFISCEVLARWNSPSRGILAPGLFIDQAEQAGVLPAIDLIIFEKGLNELSEALKRGRRVIPCSFNFSLYEFFSHNFLETITGMIDKYKVPTEYIEIEITETTSQINQFLSLSVIKKLKKMGIRVLMDDYGVGYSQIDNFNKIPFDGIKIDKSFTDHLLDDEKTKSIVKFLIELGHENNMEVIIEGVEKKEQVDILRRMHIDTIQGFYYSKPLSNNDFYELLKHNAFEKEENK